MLLMPIIESSKTTLCPEEDLILTANDGLGYEWSTGETSQSITISTTGSYSVTVTFPGSCTASNSINIESALTDPYIQITDNNGVVLDPNEPICWSNSFGSGIYFSAFEGDSYVWSFPNETGQGFGTFNVTGEILPITLDMSVTITNVGGCEGVEEDATVEFTFVAPDELAIEAEESSGFVNDNRICSGENETVTLNALSCYGNNYNWSNGQSGSIIEVSPTSTTSYSVTTTDDNGVEYVQEIEIIVEECPGPLCFCPNDEFNLGIDDGQPHLLSEIIGATSFFGQLQNCISIRGELIIDIQATFDQSQINFFPGAEIIVKNGSRLWITNSTLMSCDDQMWKGITVEDGELVFRNNTISDAQYALQVKGGTEIDVLNNTFDRNFIGLYVPPAFSNEITHEVYGNNFMCSSALLAPYQDQIPNPGDKTYAGILINNVINQFNLGTATRSNNMSDLKNGIIAYNSSLNIQNLNIENLIGTNLDLNPPFDHANEPASFNNEGIGVFVMNSNDLLINRLDVDNAFIGVYTHYAEINEITRCDIQNVDIGIQVGASEGENVLIGDEGFTGQNTINCRSEGISVFGTSIPHGPNGEPGNGAWNYGSNIRITNNHISRVEGSVLPMVGIGIYNNLAGTEESGFSGGVADINDNTITLTNNSTATFDVGIEVSNSSFIKVQDNTILEVASPGEKRMISLTGNNNCQIRNNYATGAGLGESNASGIFVMNNTLTTYCCNILNGLDEGVRFSGMCDDTDFRGTSFENITARGLLLENGTTIGVQGDPSDSDFLSGNTWENGGGAEFQTSNPDEILDNRIFFNENFPSTIPDGAPPVQGWFNNTIVKNPMNCGSQADCNIIELFGGIEDPDIKIARGELSSTLYGGGILWEGRRYLFGKISSTESLLQQDSDVDNFYNNNINSSIGIFSEIEQDIANLVDPTDPVISQINEIRKSIRETLALIKEKDNFLESAQQSCHSDLIEERAALLELLQGLQVEMQEPLQIYQQERVEKVDWIIAKNNGVNAIEIFEENRKTINDIYLNTIAVGVFQYDAQQLALLNSIASQCPLSSGNAVFMARGLLKRVQNINFNDKELCQEKAKEKNSFSSKIKVDDSHAITVFPNPSTGQLNFELNKAYDDDLNLTIYSLTGKQVRNLILPSGRKSYNFDLSSVQSGIYFYESIVNGEKMTGKIILVK